MEEYRIIMTEQADKDIESIAEYIALDDSEKAIEYVIELQAKISWVLSLFPEKYPKYKNCYMYAYGRYLVLFDVHQADKSVVVLAIVSSAQYMRYKEYLCE